jgi:hypothetical protein
VLFRGAELDAIRSGSIDLAFRRWRRPSVKPGTLLRTAIGIVEILEVAQIDPDAITDADARRAGAGSRKTVIAGLAAVLQGDVYRIVLRYAGADPRVALRSIFPSDGEIESIRVRLMRLDEASRHGPWTAAVLSLIAANDGVRAADLATQLGRETLPFKADVRKLKELGLTESLEVGYRLSPRGRTVLGFILRNLSPPRNPA